MTQPLSWSELCSLQSPWAYLVACSETDLDSFVVYKLHLSEGSVVRIIRGERCPASERLFQEWAAALQFPYYFGHNWDAFDECMCDLEWLPGICYVFFVTHVEKVLAHEEDCFKTFLDILESAALEWAVPGEPRSVRGASGNVPFRVVFHCDPQNEAKSRQRFERAGLAVAIRGLRVQ